MLSTGGPGGPRFFNVHNGGPMEDELFTDEEIDSWLSEEEENELFTDERDEKQV